VIRGLAISGVVAVHSVQTADSLLVSYSINPSPVISYVIGLGKYGVELFFFISGYLLVSIYPMEGKELGKKYVIRRIARIMPLWTLFLIFQIMRSRIGNGGGGWQVATSENSSEWPILHNPFVVVVLTLTFTLWISASLWNTVIPGGWSIQAEVAHYFLYPVVKKIALPNIMFALTTINFFTFCLNAYFEVKKLTGFPIGVAYIWEAWVRLNLFSTFSYFLLGMIGHAVIKEFAISNSWHSSFASIRITKLNAISFLLALFLAPLAFGTNLEAITFVLVTILASRGIIKFQWAKGCLINLGKYSYFIYFCHFQVFSLITFVMIRKVDSLDILGNQILVFSSIFATTMIVSTFLGYISFKFLESPIMKIANSVN
jgi:peptidoglycan/LPS O-acetylase OafA/YrhL